VVVASPEVVPGMQRAAAVCLLVLSWGCTEHDPENGRIGGPFPDAHVVFPDGSDMDAASDASDADVALDAEGGADGEADADAGPPIVPFCEAFKVMKVCRRCHEPVPNQVGAPFPLQTFEDTQGVYLGRPIKDRMIAAVDSNFMPLTIPIAGVDPPIQPLDASCKNTLLTWLRQGAQPAGGTDCDPNLSCEGCPNFP
jgi:hypothetical protein